NEKSKQEVVCQVVKTKQHGNAVGYVELKFTEATTDFWGIRTPGNGAGAAAPAAPIAAGAPTKSREPESLDRKSATPVAREPSPVAPSTPPAVPTPTVPRAAQPVAQVQAAPRVPAKPASIPTVPTLSEFLTHGSNGLELKARERQPTEKRE